MIVPSISSLIVAFIKIPEIIAKYLFNTKEDDNMNAIIKHIQDHDIKMYALENDAEKEVMKQKALKPGVEQKDSEFEQLPKGHKNVAKAYEGRDAVFGDNII